MSRTDDAKQEYWVECIASAAEDCGAALTDEQIKSIAGACEGAHENYGMAFHRPDSPYPGEIKRLQAALEKERGKIPCKICGGTGTITTHGPVHSGSSQCWKCHGEGRHSP